MVEHVRVLADIPGDPFHSQSQPLSSEIISFRGSSRKKSSELALAVNNLGVTIYDVRSGNINASYAVSPATIFTSPPCSIKLNKNGSREVQRFTYCSVLNPKPKLLRFSEEIQAVTGLGGQLKSLSIDLPVNGQSLIHIEPLATQSETDESLTIEVLCVYENGEIYCYDEALTCQRWNTHMPVDHGNEAPPKMSVLQVFSTSIEQAKATILKEHEDLLNTLDSRTNGCASQLLLLLTRSTPASSADNLGRLALQVLAVKNTEALNLTSSSLHEHHLNKLISLMIPEPDHAVGERASFRLHTSSGTLYQGLINTLWIYDLGSLVPRLAQTLKDPSVKTGLSYVRVSPGYIAISSGKSIVLIDSRYSSFQAKYDLPKPKKFRSPAAHGVKSESNTAGAADAQLISFHSPSGSAVVLSGRTLMAVDLSKSTTRKLLSRKRKEGGLLIDSVGRGSLTAEEQRLPQKRIKTLPQALGHYINPCEKDETWKNTKTTLNGFLDKGRTSDFDRIVASTFSKNDAALPHITEYKLDYLFGKMFSSKATVHWKDGCVVYELGVRLLPEQTWNYMLQEGLVTAERIEASLKRQELMSGNSLLKEAGLIRALADWDPTLTVLSSLLQSPCLIKINEVCYAMKVAIASFAKLAIPGEQKLLTNRSEPIVSNPDPMDETETSNVGSDGGVTQITGHNERFQLLFDKIIARCDACPPSLVTKALKSELSKSELRNVIDLLRMKLAQNGWLSPYTDNGYTPDPPRRHNDNQVSMIGKLLNCAVDSLGTGGWLLNNSVADDSAEAKETISYMKAEISAALEGIEEATYLQGMLGEILMCGKSALHSSTSRPPLAGVDWEDQERIPLPLGLKLDQGITMTKVGAGGELQRRSRRDIGKLKSRKVPKYSFERIRI
ncbi:MAG: hypothetical protein Q9218_006512 [Villophora microphyllina]